MTAARHLLIADDDVVNRAIYDELFAESYDLEIVDDGDACLASFARRRPDLLILDVAMPGVTGLEICRRLRADSRYARLPILLVSGFAAQKDRERGLAAGADGYISKPFDLDEFEALVAELAARGAADAAA